MGEITQKRASGNYGEDIAAAFLKQKGYKIVDRNFLCRLGEIDIIASDDAYLAFYLSRHETELQPRFDVIEVYTPGGMGAKAWVRLIEDAFR